MTKSLEDVRKNHQTKTFREALKKLKTKGKVAVLRPTGFGKTWLATSIIKHFKKVLYVYPTEIIKNTVEDRYNDLVKENEDNWVDEDTLEVYNELGKIPNCDMMTYAKLARLKGENIDDLLKENYDLIIFDECHRMCAKKARINIFKILEKSRKKIKYIGLTATPIRSDGLDVVAEFFDNVMVYSYSIIDAINDGLLKKPYYVYCDYEEEFEEEVKKKIMESALQVDNEWEDSPEYKREIFKGRILENIDKADTSMINIIKTYTEKYICANYMKFIVFFRDIEHMDNKLNEVISWFEEAYPDYEIKTLRVSSKNKEESEEVGKRLATLKRKNKTIHLIACIDMLNMGYHVKNISGIIMYRGTHSSLIYTQQLGRIMSAGSNKKTIIFDIVDNIHRKAIFESPVVKDEEDQGLRLTDFRVNKNNEVVIYDEEGNEVKTEYYIDENGKVVDEDGEETEFIYDKESGNIYEKIGPDSTFSGRVSDIDLTEECFDPVSDIATTRELIAKLEAELLSQKCHWVLETHLRSWCVVHGYPYPITRENSKEFYDKRYEEFYNWFADLIREKKLDYPYYDIEKLLYIGNKENDIQTSLEICASVKNISVSRVLDILGFK